MNNVRTLVVIVFSLVIAFILTILPVPNWAIWLRPQWVVMVMIFWTLALPSQVSIGTAWMVGLFLDVMLGSLLGEHALCLSLVTYFVVKFRFRVQLLQPWQRHLAVLGFIFLYQLILFLLLGAQGKIPLVWYYWLSPFTSILFWPWVYGILKGCQKRFRISDATTRSYNL